MQAAKAEYPAEQGFESPPVALRRAKHKQNQPSLDRGR